MLRCLGIRFRSTSVIIAWDTLCKSKHFYKFNAPSCSNSSVSSELKLPSVPATKVEFLEKLLLQQYDCPKDARVLKVAVIGCPNCGKSSLVNMLTRWRVCAVAGKAHTTRSKQIASLNHDNVQVVFVDLPGLVNSSKAWHFNLDRSFMRDPHSAIFESDIVLVVVDVGHKYSRLELDPEIVKLLHFFRDKESILVLNKIDKLKHNPTILLDVTRKLTGGVVNGVSSHIDKYAARFERRSRIMASSHRLIPPSELISAYLPPVCHESINKFLQHIADIQKKLHSTDMRLLTRDNEPISLNNHQIVKSESNECTKNTVNWNLTLMSNRDVTEVELQSINDYFSNYERQNNAQMESQTSVNDSLAVADEIDSGSDFIDGSYDAMLEELKTQLLLNSASREEVAARRERWLSISDSVRGIKNWSGFSEVFMVSSTFGDGINTLRDCLISKALPNRKWILPSCLITDQEPSELARMCVWAQCLNRLQKEIPYSLKISVDSCDKAKMDDGDDRIFVHARILCQNEYQLKTVLGPNGSTIKEIAASTKLELMTMFRANTVVKLTAQVCRIPSYVKKRLREAHDFASVLPEFNKDNATSA